MFRLLPIETIGETIFDGYDYEEEHFECITDQPACRQQCFNRFNPMSFRSGLKPNDDFPSKNMLQNKKNTFISHVYQLIMVPIIYVHVKIKRNPSDLYLTLQRSLEKISL